MDKHHFLLRRLHSLAGVLPIGVFLIMLAGRMVWHARRVNARSAPTPDPS